MNLVDLVRMLKTHLKQHDIPELTDQDRELLAQRILPTAWYPFEAFERLLVLAHRYVLKNSDEGAIQMGAFAARKGLLGPHRAFLYEGDIERTLRNLHRVWSMWFDFSTLAFEPTETGGRVVLRDYPNLTRTHGLSIVGWVAEVAQLTGVPNAKAQLVAAPWTGASELVIRVDWK